MVDQYPEQPTCPIADAELLKSKLRVIKGNHSMYVIAVAVSGQLDRNQQIKIPTAKGIPLGGYVHDALHQCFYVRAVETLNLGVICLSFFIQCDGSPFWEVSVPVPTCMVRQHLDDAQKKELARFEQSLPPGCKVYFLQLINHNS